MIVQGRYDIVCPAESAYQLHQAWPKSKLIVAPQSGHSALEPEITEHLVAATTSPLAREFSVLDSVGDVGVGA